jgi:hypothetical protein
MKKAQHREFIHRNLHLNELFRVHTQRTAHQTIDNHESGAKSEQPNLKLMSYYALEQTASSCVVSEIAAAHQYQSVGGERNYQFALFLIKQYVYVFERCRMDKIIAIVLINH